MAELKEKDEWEPSTWDELFPGVYLKQSHLSSRGTQITIERIFNRVVDGKIAQVVKFAAVQGIDQRDWGLNKTNGLCLRDMFGDDIKSWFGKRVVLQPSVVEHGREKGKPCIRICASPDIASDLSVVIDFHTKRIKPFTIKVRALTEGKTAPRSQVSATVRARELSSLLRSDPTITQLNQIALDTEASLEADAITRDEAKELMKAIETKSQAIKAKAEKDSSNVIS